MVCPASQGGHSPRVRRLRVRRGRDPNPRLRRHVRVREIQQRAVRASGLQVSYVTGYGVRFCRNTSHKMS